MVTQKRPTNANAKIDHMARPAPTTCSMFMVTEGDINKAEKAVTGVIANEADTTYGNLEEVLVAPTAACPTTAATTLATGQPAASLSLFHVKDECNHDASMATERNINKFE